MIISASYKTDIPAFYGRWFMNRLRAGYCKMVNPYNRHHVTTVDLRPDAVDGFIFWTKNAGPFLDQLHEVKRRGHPFIVQYTINGYPRTLETSVVDSNRSVEHMRRLREHYGPRAAVWRYDTIVVTSETPPDFHRRNFDRLSRELEGTTDEVVVSFAQIYRKTERNMNLAASEVGFEWRDPTDVEKQRLASELALMAQARGMQLSLCGQRQLLVPGVVDASCIDSGRLAGIAGRPVVAEKRGSRRECGCHASKDIGDYDTCPHGCVYCYAVQNRELALARHKQHDPDGEFLFPIDAADAGGSAKRQLRLFE